MELRCCERAVAEAHSCGVLQQGAAPTVPRRALVFAIGQDIVEPAEPISIE